MSSKAASRHKRYDFFTRHFPGINLSDWKMLEDAMKKDAWCGDSYCS